MTMRNMLIAGFMFITAWSASAQDADTSWISLFNGESLDGWKASEYPASFAVEEGTIVAHGERAHLFYVATTDFTNFHFKADVRTASRANSGIYFGNYIT